MAQLYIPFTEEPLNLEATLIELSFKPNNPPSTWMENGNNNPQLRVDIYPIEPYTIRVSTASDGPIAKARINELVTKMKENYPEIIGKCYKKIKIQPHKMKSFLTH